MHTNEEAPTAGPSEEPTGEESAAEVETPLSVDDQVAECVEYVFGPGFAGEIEKRTAFVARFMEGADLMLFSDFNAAFGAVQGNDPNYLSLHELYYAIQALPEEQREVAFVKLRMGLQLRQANVG
jgi:hypothetical protein